MPEKKQQKIVIIGCGNVAWHVCKQIASTGGYLTEVYNHRESERLREFRSMGCRTVAGFHAIAEDADFYFICVPDQFIAETARQVNARNPRTLMVHTSGSTTLEALGERAHDTGVFYPLQTFSREDAVDWKEVPLILEAGTAAALIKLKKTARLFSARLYTMDYRQRLKLHLAAVLVNNFTNALYVAAAGLLKQEGNVASPGFSLLLPLIRQTTGKAHRMDPVKAQTGPASRKDKTVMEQHLGLLQKKSELRRLYKLFSKLIIQQQQSTHAEF